MYSSLVAKSKAHLIFCYAQLLPSQLLAHRHVLTHYLHRCKCYILNKQNGDLRSSHLGIKLQETGSRAHNTQQTKVHICREETKCATHNISNQHVFTDSWHQIQFQQSRVNSMFCCCGNDLSLLSISKK